MNEVTLEAQCFGGTYKANVYDSGECITTSHITLGSCSPTGTCTVFFRDYRVQSQESTFQNLMLPLSQSES